MRERAPIDDIVGEHVTLRNAGGGSLKGLCPFHDEKSPTFHVTPAKGLYHCFGCGEGGDVIAFVRKIDHLTFAEAVEQLAARAGVQLRYEEAGSAPRRQQGERTRLVEANRVAAGVLRRAARDAGGRGRATFLDRARLRRRRRPRTSASASPRRAGTRSTRHLRGRGFTDRGAGRRGGLAKEGPRGLIDRFRGRLLWPIRDITGDIIGFGARKLLRRRPRAEVPQHPRDADLQEDPGALRHRPRQARDRQAAGRP